MKTAIAVTLIIMGALLIMTPVLADFLYQRHVVSLLAQSGFERVTLAGQMSPLYRFGCWFTGTAMIAITVLRCVLSREAPQHTRLATQPA